MLAQRLNDTLQRLENVALEARRPTPRLIAVSKTRSAMEIAALAGAGQRFFGENYVQEAQAKIAEVGDLGLEWHLIGHLQSNKAELAATLFDWVHTVDRIKVVAPLARYRPPEREPLNVLIQVNIDGEASKHGCPPLDLPPLMSAVLAQPRLRLRGLMAIPAPHPRLEDRRIAYRRMKTLFDALADWSTAVHHAQVDTLSMGMSEDYAMAVAEGATMVRIGSALFGARAPSPPQTLH
ncbi:MAG TPA: YggS family pyridoxal phosphate-dependent enzyme [Pseudoxanthomonas sp.]|nr:YggS family pyridoxal phosphate-dependent enzyme [Pseudoxanthomonas sp.]